MYLSPAFMHSCSSISEFHTHQFVLKHPKMLENVFLLICSRSTGVYYLTTLVPKIKQRL